MAMKRRVTVTVFLLMASVLLALLYAAAAEARPVLHSCDGGPEGITITDSHPLHDVFCGAHEPTATSTSTPTPTSTATATPTSTSTATPLNTATATPTPTSTATATPLNTATATSTPLPGSTSTPTATATSRVLRANTPTPTATSRSLPAGASTPTNGEQSEKAPTATPTRRALPTTAPTPTSRPLPAVAPEPQGAESFSPQAPCLVAHAATPAQLCLTAAGIEYYFIGPDGVASGPLLPSISQLAGSYSAFSPTVELYRGTNPLSGKAVHVDYLPSENAIRVSTYYADTPYSVDKPYIFTLDEGYQVTHQAW